MTNFLNRFFLIAVITILCLPVVAEEFKKNSEHQYNFYTGNFDFSDDTQKAILLGFQHQNELLERDTFLGNAISNYRWIYN